MTAPTAIPSALDRLDEIRARAGGRRLAVLLDFDGTLTPIVARPEDAVLAPEMRERVRRLAATRPVAVVSGRDLADVRARVAVDGLTYAGSHGLDVDGPGVRHDAGEDAATAVARALAALRARLPPVAGLVLEPKRFGVAVHYRQVDPAAVPVLARVVDAIVREVGGLRRTEGKMVFEVQPDVPWDKGRAVRTLVDLHGGAAVVHAVYVGDDRTDEDAFAALGADGTGIVVCETPRPTAARYRLRDPDEVGAFLDGVRS